VTQYQIKKFYNAKLPLAALAKTFFHSHLKDNKHISIKLIKKHSHITYFLDLEELD
jgi:hypothetical protein